MAINQTVKNEQKYFEPVLNYVYMICRACCLHSSHSEKRESVTCQAHDHNETNQEQLM